MAQALQKVSFKKAVKYAAKARVALIGPPGSGKSFTMLKLARQLAGPNGKIAAVDTEHGSLSKYAHTPKCGGHGVCTQPDHFEFDVIEPDSYSTDLWLSALKTAIEEGYDVFCSDSLSHFWMGKDGALEFVDEAKKKSKSRDDMSGWKEFRPHERAMVDAMIASPLHIICTLRTKNAYEEQEYVKDGQKKTKRVKVGLAPVQREGLEYEFDVVGLMDDENSMIIDKSRCSALSGRVIDKPGDEDFAPFIDWLSGEKPPEEVKPLPDSIPAANSNPTANANAEAFLRRQKAAEELKAAIEAAPQDIADLWRRMGTKVSTMLPVVNELFSDLKEVTGATVEYDAIADKHGFMGDVEQAIKQHGVMKTLEFTRALFQALQDTKEMLSAGVSSGE
jgi:DNA polymerase III delta prime subunit